MFKAGLVCGCESIAKKVLSTICLIDKLKVNKFNKLQIYLFYFFLFQLIIIIILSFYIGTGDWKEYESVLDVPDDTFNIGFGILLNG
jgi:hypothetical protein